MNPLQWFDLHRFTRKILCAKIDRLEAELAALRADYAELLEKAKEFDSQRHSLGESLMAEQRKCEQLEQDLAER